MQHGPPPPPRPATPVPPLNPPPPPAEIPAPPVLKVVVVSPLPPKVTMPSLPFRLEPLATVKPTAPIAGVLADGEPAASSPSVNEVIGPTMTVLLKRCSDPVNVLLAANWAKAPATRPPSLAAFTLVRNAPLPEKAVAVMVPFTF